MLNASCVAAHNNSETKRLLMSEIISSECGQDKIGDLWTSFGAFTNYGYECDTK